jgi:hypothetical protein
MNDKRLRILRVLAQGPLTRPELDARLPDISWKRMQNGLDTAAAEGLVMRIAHGESRLRHLHLTDAGRAYLARRTGTKVQPQRAHQPDVAPAVPAAATADVSGSPAGDSGSTLSPPPTPAAGAVLSAIVLSPPDDSRAVTRHHHLLDAARVELNDYLEQLRPRDPKLNRLMLIYHYARLEAGLEGQ